MPEGVEFQRTVDIRVRDAAGELIKGANITWKVAGEDYGGASNTEGFARITLINCRDPLEVIVEYEGREQRQLLAADQEDFTFHYPEVTLYPNQSWGDILKKHVPVIIGVGFILLSVVLAFVFGNPTPLQHRIILVVIALGGGAFGTEISGMLKADLKFGQKVAISATGAAAVFVILFFFVPAPTESASSPVTTPTAPTTERVQ